MKKIGLILISLFLGVAACATAQTPKNKQIIPGRSPAEKEIIMKRLEEIYTGLNSKKFLSWEERDYLMSRGILDRKWPLKDTIWDTALSIDGLPYKPTLYLELEKENHDRAEQTRKLWIADLERLETYCRYALSADAVSKMYQQLKQLKEVVGLTDAVLVPLRKELVIAIKEKKWDDASKIQNIITARINELKPPQPQAVYKDTPGSGNQTTVVVQQPSEQHVKVEDIPRYGATDIGRAISLIKRGASSLTPKEAGALGLLDIIMKR